MIDAKQDTPWQSHALAFEQAFENHAVALEKYAGDFLGGLAIGVSVSNALSTGRATAPSLS